MRILYALALGATLAAPVAVAGNKPGGPARPSAGINPKALVVAGRIIVKLQPGQDVGLLDKVAGALQAAHPSGSIRATVRWARKSGRAVG